MQGGPLLPELPPEPCPSTPAHAGQTSRGLRANSQSPFNPCARRADIRSTSKSAAVSLQPLRMQGGLRLSGETTLDRASTPADRKNKLCNGGRVGAAFIASAEARAVAHRAYPRVIYRINFYITGFIFTPIERTSPGPITPPSRSWPNCAACPRPSPVRRPCGRPAVAAAARAGWARVRRSARACG